MIIRVIELRFRKMATSIGTVRTGDATEASHEVLINVIRSTFQSTLFWTIRVMAGSARDLTIDGSGDACRPTQLDKTRNDIGRSTIWQRGRRFR